MSKSLKTNVFITKSRLQSIKNNARKMGEGLKILNIHNSHYSIFFMLWTFKNMLR